MTTPKLPRPFRPDDFMPPRLEDYYQPSTPQGGRDLANAYAMRQVNRGLRRVVRMLDRRLDAMAARDAARRWRRP